MPVSVHDGRLDLLSYNAAAAQFFGQLSATGRFRRSIVYLCFTAAEIPELLDEDGAELLARGSTAELRRALSRYPNDEYLHALRDELWKSSDAFRRHWEGGTVDSWRSAVKHLRHPTRGWFSFDAEILHDPERDHWVMLYTPRNTV